MPAMPGRSVDRDDRRRLLPLLSRTPHIYVNADELQSRPEIQSSSAYAATADDRPVGTSCCRRCRAETTTTNGATARSPRQRIAAGRGQPRQLIRFESRVLRVQRSCVRNGSYWRHRRASPTITPDAMSGCRSTSRAAGTGVVEQVIRYVLPACSLVKVRHEGTGIPLFEPHFFEVAVFDLVRPDATIRGRAAVVRCGSAGTDDHGGVGAHFDPARLRGDLPARDRRRSGAVDLCPS